MTSMSTPFPKEQLNLVELPEWQKTWETTGDVGEWAWMNAVDTWKHIVIGGGECKDYVSDVDSRLTDAQMDVICTFLENRDNRLELTEQAIMDSLTWAFELAYIPEDGDLEDALGRAIENVAEETFFEGELFEGTMDKLGIHPDRLLEELLGLIEYKRPKIKGRPAWERYLVFDFGKSDLLRKLAKGPFFLKREHQREGPKEWAPMLEAGETKREAREAIQEELDSIRERTESEFWKMLDNVMQHRDPFNRVDTAEQWKLVLTDKDRMKGARKEIREFLKNLKEEL